MVGEVVGEAVGEEVGEAVGVSAGGAPGLLTCAARQAATAASVLALG